ncbi:MAG: DUF402 domain-containing protein [Chloroflexi bacterium]|nr:DUF402 domain-containing protein [Chloroflexota bacterium]
MNPISRWIPGDRIVMRSVWGDRIQAAWPVTVVCDTTEALVLYLAAGTVYKMRTYTSEGRLPIGEWNHLDREWTADMLRIMLPGDQHAYLAFWDQELRFSRWYVNLEREYIRTDMGIDFIDHFLDIVIEADLKTWRWKDEAELSRAVSLNLVSRKQAEEIRAEGCLALSRRDAGIPPFGQGWECWTPNSEWSVPTLPPDWWDL